MGQEKYAKYFREGWDLPVEAPERDGKMIIDLMTGELDFPETPNWVYAGLVHEAGTGFGFGDTLTEISPDGEKDSWQTGPHVHSVPETIVFVGTDPSKPHDLCAEVDFWLGQGEEAEKYTITKSTTVFVPPNTVHTPIWVRKVERPFIFFAVLNDPKGSKEMGGIPLPPDFSKDL